MPKKRLNNSLNSKRIGLDCRLAGIENSGIGRYITELVHQLLKLDSSSIYVLFCRNQNQADQLIAGSLNLKVELVIADIPHYSWLEQLVMPIYFWRAKLDLLHIPHFNVPLLTPGLFLVTIHDLLWHQYQGTQVTTLNPLVYLTKYAFYKLVVGRAVSQAVRILVPSATIKRTVISYYPQTAKKIQVTTEGATNLPSAQSDGLIVPDHYLLFVGNLYPHKNIAVVLKALIELTKLHLVICGSRDAFTQQVLTEAKNLGVADRVQHVGRVSDQQLAYLYQTAVALIQPSKSEGFGLTGLEAMSKQCPVIAAKTPIFEEIYQDAAQYFDSKQPAELVAQIEQLGLPAKRSAMLERQHNLLAQYSWEKMARQTLREYQACLSQTNHSKV